MGSQDRRPSRRRGCPIAATKTVSPSGAAEGRAKGPVMGWSVLEADNAEAAVQLLSDHPFVSRGGSLQINEPAPI